MQKHDSRPLEVAPVAKVSMQAAKPRRHDTTSRFALLLPTIVIVLFMSIFPLIISLFLSFTNVTFVRGGIKVVFVGLRNYNKLLFGSNQRHLIGAFGNIPPIGWFICLVVTGWMIYWLYSYTTSRKRSIFGTVFRLIAAVMTTGLVWICVSTLSDTGVPGTMVVTLIFVLVGVFFQYAIGLALALLLVQSLPGKRFFRVVFLLPMMITPVGVGFLFRMMTDTSIGPFAPTWISLGLKDYSWVETGAGARAAILIGDIWQWTPFMFIILLAALEGVSREQVEAALVDGANKLDISAVSYCPKSPL